MKFKKGHCLCSKIEIQVPEAKKDLGVCHCGMCRKWSGGPFFAIDCGTEIEIKGKENLGIYNSSDWAERGFCKNCGSSLFYRLKDNSFYAVSSELFNDSELNFVSQVFIDAKPDYYDFLNETQKMTGEELFAAHAPKE